MNLPHWFRVAAIALLAAGLHLANAAELSVDRATLGRLFTLKQGQWLTLDAFPVGPTRVASIRFERVTIFSEDAHIYVEDTGGRRELALGNQVFLRGYSDDGSARIALAFGANGSLSNGHGSGPGGSFTLHVSAGTSGALRLSAESLVATLPAGFRFDMRCGNDGENLEVHSFDDLSAQLRALAPTGPASVTATTSHALRLATVAIDTDSLFMSRLFSNNTSNATNWIASMFNIMNLMYERDLLVRLMIGTTILRTSPGTDPYSGFSSGGVTTQELSTFGNYWKTNEAAVTRNFAILLSGQIPSDEFGCSSSGLAWVNQYCQKGFTSGMYIAGSYSVEKVCSTLSLDPDGGLDARLVGHELGHNFGAQHTHCTDKTSGSAPVAANTIDTCFNTEGSCYAGTRSCPAVGAGTIMSYCNFTPGSGCADNTQNLLEFHPTHISKVLLPAITTSGSCLNTTDDVFYSGFES